MPLHPRLFTSYTVFESPAFGSVWKDFKIHTTTIGKFV